MTTVAGAALLLLFLALVSLSSAEVLTRPRLRSDSGHAAVHNCIHHLLINASEEQVVAPQQYESASSRRRLSSPSNTSHEPIRIHAHYAFSSSTPLQQRVRNVVVPHAIEHYRRSLLVQRVQTPLRFTANCTTMFSNNVCKTVSSVNTCGGVNYPSSWSARRQFCASCTQSSCSSCANSTHGAGVAADFALVVDVRDTARCQSSPQTLAYAATCQRDQHDRPVLSYVVFCPNAMENETAALQNNTAVHEIAHALGFTASSYARMRNASLMPRTQRDANGDIPIQTASCASGSTQQVALPSATTLQSTDQIRSVPRSFRLVTPALRDQARAHFACPNARGVELENTPTTSGACWGSHWETRVLNGELMTATVTGDDAFSAFTLAYFEDTGWYRANYDMAQYLPWGYHAGCGFTDSDCLDQASVRGRSFFCNQNNAWGCSPDLRYRTRCVVGDYNQNLPQGFQHFSQLPRRGGTDALLDYCPSYATKLTSASDCRSTAGVVAQYRGESHGASSVCLRSTLVRDDFVAVPTVHGVCYEVRCGASSLTIVVRLRASLVREISCRSDEEGAQKSVTDFSGVITCPNFFDACPPSGAGLSSQACPPHLFACSGHGSCLASNSHAWSCQCETGWTGPACAVANCPDACSGHGTCSTSVTCSCDSGWTGSNCGSRVTTGGGVASPASGDPELSGAPGLAQLHLLPISVVAAAVAHMTTLAWFGAP